MPYRNTAANVAPNAFAFTTNFKKFGTPTKDFTTGNVVPGSWTFAATINGARITFKAPYPELRSFNGIKLQYCQGLANNNDPIDWFDLYDAISTVADATSKVEAQTAISAMTSW